MDCHNPDMLKMSKEELAEQVTVDDKPMPSKAKPPGEAIRKKLRDIVPEYQPQPCAPVD